MSFITLLEAARPQYIKVADKPLGQGGVVKGLSVEEFQKQFTCTYSENIEIDRAEQIDNFSENITGDLPAYKLKEQVGKILKVAADYLVLCNMQTYGYGVFTSKKLVKDTVVAVFAGTIVRGQQFSDKKDHGLGFFQSRMSFSSQRFRGIASFFQHLPELPKFPDAKTFSQMLTLFGQNVSETQLKLNVELYSTTFAPRARRDLAVENIRMEYLNYNNIPLIALVTNRDIDPNEQLGFNYGYHYWQSREMSPIFFSLNGNPVDKTQYKRTFGHLKFGDFSYTGEFKPLLDALCKGGDFIKIVDDKNRQQEIASVLVKARLRQANAL